MSNLKTRGLEKRLCLQSIEPDHILATAATNGAVVLWNLNRPSRSKQEHVFVDHKRTVNKVCFHSTEPTKLISGSQDGTMRLFDLRTKEKQSNMKSLPTVDIGFAGSAALKGIKDIKLLEFRGDCQQFLVDLCNKLLHKCPPSYKIVKGASCLSPTVMLNPSVRTNSITCALEVLQDNKQLSSVQADVVKRDYLDFVSKQEVIDYLKQFTTRSDQLDKFFMNIVSRVNASQELQYFTKNLLVLFHINAAVEQSYSVNKECLNENLHEDSLIAQHVTYDAVNAAGGFLNMTISKKIIPAVRNASGIRKEVLEKKKKIEVDLSQKRKTASEEIRKLEVKRRTVLQKSKEEAEVTGYQQLKCVKITTPMHSVGTFCMETLLVRGILSLSTIVDKPTTAPNTESVRDVQFSPHQSYVFVAVSENGNVQLWDMRRPDRWTQQFTAHSGPVFTCDWHPAEPWLATASRDKTIKISWVFFTDPSGSVQHCKMYQIRFDLNACGRVETVLECLPLSSPLLSTPRGHMLSLGYIMVGVQNVITHYTLGFRGANKVPKCSLHLTGIKECHSSQAIGFYLILLSGGNMLRKNYIIESSPISNHKVPLFHSAVETHIATGVGRTSDTRATDIHL
uniref:GATOR2 complex protein WDR24 n=1 Tax=Timema douglasi TaxID=61478 RepID=A0A7R8ZC56_TIMDO|nr:unnamed protein product [Timema douglasi]